MPPIRIILAEDHEVVREGLRGVLSAQPDLMIVAEAKDGIEAIDKVGAHPADVLILDLSLPRLHGLHVLSRLKARKSLKTIVLTMHGDAASAMEALRLGARGYVLKNDPSSELIAAIRSVARNNDVFVSKPLDSFMNKAAINAITKRGEVTAGKLITRETMVLRDVAQGKTNVEIAASLGISSRTVEKHRARFRQKLNFRTQCDVVRFAIREGILQQ